MLASNIKSIDSFCPKIRKDYFFDYPLAQYVLKYKKSSRIFSKYGRDEQTTDNQVKFPARSPIALDSLYRNRFKPALKSDSRNYDQLYWALKNRYSNFRNYLLDLARGYTFGVSPIKMWNISIVTALFFGMFLMTFIYRYLGQDAAARSSQIVISNSVSQTEKIAKPNPTYPGMVLGEENVKSSDEVDNYVTQIIQDYQKGTANQDKLEKLIKKMVKGYPIEKMVPYISQKDPIVAAFIISIAKKESGWGLHAPVLDGQDCLNYWGYRGKRKRMGTGGHACFDSYQDAVDTVAKRIEALVNKEKITTPDEMVTVWKCGYDCSWDDPKAVKKWVSDVDMYFSKFNDVDEN